MVDFVSRRSFMALLLACAALAGCASGTYRAPEARNLGAASLAILEMDKRNVVTVVAVNGQSRGWGLFDRYELAPGATRITVGLIEGGATRTSEPLQLEFTAQSGSTYRLEGLTVPGAGGGGRWGAWIVDASGKRVSTVVQKQPGA